MKLLQSNGSRNSFSPIRIECEVGKGWCAAEKRKGEKKPIWNRENIHFGFLLSLKDMIKSEERRRADPQPIGNFALEQGGSCLSWTSSVAAGEIAAAAKKAPGAAETVAVVSILCPLCTQSAKKSKHNSVAAAED